MNIKLTRMKLLSPIAIGIALAWGTLPAHAGPGLGISASGATGIPTFYANSPAGTWTDFNNVVHNSGTALRKFVDALPGLCGAAGTPIPAITHTPGTPVTGACIPVANPQPSPVAGDIVGGISTVDYYEIGIVDYTQPMHADLPKATRLRGYVQLDDPANPVRNLDGSINLALAKANARYLGPIIVASKDRPVRIKYTNLLPTQAAGQLFIPVDTTLMGAGVGPDNTTLYTQNRIAIHLHGGHTPWISDGTPHQWTVPVGETTAQAWQAQGASFQNVPDMADPGQGSGTLYYTNDQPSRLMFYHDHAVGITRLNVYTGIAAGYVVRDKPATGEDVLVNGGTISYTPAGTATPVNVVVAAGTVPVAEIPLVIQDKTFVPADVSVQDAKWDPLYWGAYGDLWFPHVYEVNQDPTSMDGTNPVGRWDWGPWFWPVFPAQFPLPTGVFGDVSSTPEAFMDTPVVNGMAYPSLTVDPKAYRFRVLNAANDRMLNLGLYVADPLTVAVTHGGSGYTAPVTVTFSPPGAMASATVSTGILISVDLNNVGLGYTTTPAVTIAPPAAGGVQATAVATVGNVQTKIGVVTGIVLTNPGSGYSDTAPPLITIASPTCAAGPGCVNAQAVATVAAPGVITSVTVTDPGTYTAPPSISFSGGPGTGATAYATLGTEVRMARFDATYVPPTTLSPNGSMAFPTTGGLVGTGWGTPDARVGGVPDPATAGPDIVQIGTEGGLLPQPAIIPSTPINYEYNKRSVTVLGVLEHGLLLGPAERADAVIDFCKYAGQTLIVYNDAPAPLPAGDPRLDYYTGGPDQSAFGGMASPLPGFGPNTRTLMQIKVSGTPGSCTTPWDPAPLLAALPAAYGQTQDPPIVGESVYNQSFGAAYLDNYARIGTGSAQDPLFSFAGGAGGSVSAISLNSPSYAVVSFRVTGAGYKTAPTVTIAPPCAPFPVCGGSLATASNATLSVSAITVTNGGSGYTSAPTVRLSAPPAASGAMLATATAMISKGKVVGLMIMNPGTGYTTMPTVTFSGGGGKNAAAVATGGVTVPIANPPIPSGIMLTGGGAGYTGNPAITITPPPCTVNGTTCVAATAAATVNAMTSLVVKNKAIQELFEPTYGRMNATLGVELPVTNNSMQTTIPLGYIDPATETIADGETQIWKITHNGVDTHPVHFHLMNVQLINRVGWDGTVKPPPANEVGWKETIRMNPLEDIVVAVKAVAPKLSFGIPDSIRPLAPDEPLGTTMGFTQVDPVTGNPATISNVVANFGWEYVWHCHILGHEENDFMRPVVFNVTSTVPAMPATLTAVAGPNPAGGREVALAWTDATTGAGSPANEVGFRIERSTNANFRQSLVTANAPANTSAYVDTGVVAGTKYYYRVSAYNAAGSTTSNTVSLVP